ncbi:hypothetical protein HPB47_015293 [Ixodes persulcatus]|uniref:Uncharacterized protein n=1 Tax=Ixodes persulcatus TaxID=34615 RepID=A0AC60QU05_IXOPE|nr:hypothetical protein HPB47_015293 [Ixodes persulcatus]
MSVNETTLKMTVVYDNSSRMLQTMGTNPQGVLDIHFVLLSSLSIAGTVVNLITLAALLQSPRLRSRATTAFVLNLSLADLLFSLFNGPLDSAVFYNGGWVYGRALCVLTATTRHVAVGCSLASIQLITLNRYVSVVRPRAYGRIFSQGSCLLLVSGCWLLPAVLLLPATSGLWGRMGYDALDWSCTVCGTGCADAEPVLYRTVLYVGAGLMPVLLFAFCYPRLFMALRHSRRRLTSHYLSRSVMMQPWNAAPPSSTLDVSSLGVRSNSLTSAACRERQLLLMLAAILVSFGVCYLPLLLTVGLGLGSGRPWLRLVIHGAFYAAPCLNPLVYVAMSRDYRRAYKALFCGVQPARRGSESELNHNNVGF